VSRENVEIVRRFAVAYRRGDIAAMLGDADPDLITHRAQPDAATYHRPEGLLQAFADWVESFDEFTATADKLIDANERQVMMRVHQRAVGSESGAPIEANFWFVYTLSEQKIVRLDMYADREQALEAVGLRE
jgi:ketosteroid isomerase-like protein